MVEKNNNRKRYELKYRWRLNSLRDKVNKNVKEKFIRCELSKKLMIHEREIEIVE